MRQAAHLADDRLRRPGRRRARQQEVADGDIHRGVERREPLDELVDEADPLCSDGVEPAARPEQSARACVSPIRAITYGAMVAGRIPSRVSVNPKRVPASAMTRSATAQRPMPAAEREPVHAGDDRRRTRVDRLEHLGHRHRVVLVRLAVEVERRAHPRDVGAGAERRPVAGQDDAAQSVRRLPRERRERGSQVGDRGRVERVVDLGPGRA